ncbi:MAG: PAS domain S-box protein, partial [Methanobacterium sp.]|nr:PAS domain S-box protein [Methanobacterium sp.]
MYKDRKSSSIMSDVSNEFLINYRTIFESSPDAVIITQSDGSISYANSAAEKLFGYTQEEICELGRSGLVDITDPNLNRMLVEREKTGKYNGELIHIKKDGSKFPAEISANSFKDEKNIKHNLITIRDISKRKSDENKNNFQSLLLSKVNDAVFGLDLNFKIVYLNWGAKKMFGYTQDEVLGRNPYELLKTNINHETVLLEHGFNGNTSTIIGVKHKNGKNLIVEQNITDITTDSTAPAGYVAIYHDMTDYKLVESKVQQTLKRLYSILSNLRAGVLLVTNDNRIEYLNSAFCEYFHLNEQPEDLIGISDKDMITKIKNRYRDPEVEIKRIKEITGINKPVTDEEVNMKTGETCIRDIIPINMDGKSYGRLWLHLDISERKKVEEHKQKLLENREKLTKELQASNQELISLTEKLQVTNQIVEANRDELLTVNRALKESQEKFSKAFHANSASVAISDLDGKFSDVNLSYTQLTGYTRSELIGNSSVELGIISPEDRQIFKNELVDKGSVRRMEIKIYTKSGDKRIVITDAEIIEVEGNIKIITFNFDMTERIQIMKEREKLLKDVQRKKGELSTLIENIVDEVWFCDAQGNIILANASARNFQAKLDTECPDTLNNLISSVETYTADGSVRLTSGSPLYRALKGEVLKDFEENVVIPKTGEKLNRHVTSAPIKDDKGRITGAVAVVRDTTKRKETEDILINTLKERNQLNRTLMALRKSSFAMMHAVDEEFYLNEVCRIIIEECGHSMVWIGYTEEETKKVVPVAYSGFEEDYLKTLNLTWDDSKFGNGPTGTAIRTGKICMCENMLEDPKFKPWREEALKRGYASSIVFPLINNKQVFGALTIYSPETNPFSDEEKKLLQELANDISFGITALRLQKAHDKAENALRNSLIDLKRSNAELEQFAYITSHDLREPLRMITSFLQLLERRYKNELDSDAHEFIDFAVNGAKRLDSMINDILIYSRVTKKNRVLERVDMNSVIDKTCLNLKTSIDKNNARIVYNHLPTIMADENLMVQLFQNLIGNSIKYKSDAVPEIHITSLKKDSKWLFCVKDNGIGISKEYLEKIFVVFQRLHTAQEYEGTGIGLAIAQKIVQQHGGNIWVK